MLEIIKTLVDKGSTKMYMGLGGIAALYHLSTTDQSTWQVTTGIVVIVVTFFIFRRLQEMDKKP